MKAVLYPHPNSEKSESFWHWVVRKYCYLFILVLYNPLTLSSISDLWDISFWTFILKLLQSYGSYNKKSKTHFPHYLLSLDLLWIIVYDTRGEVWTLNNTMFLFPHLYHNIPFQDSQIYHLSNLLMVIQCFGAVIICSVNGVVKYGFAISKFYTYNIYTH